MSSKLGNSMGSCSWGSVVACGCRVKGGEGHGGGGRMRLSRNGVPSLVKAPEDLRKVARAGRARLISPSMAPFRSIFTYRSHGWTTRRSQRDLLRNVLLCQGPNGAFHSGHSRRWAMLPMADYGCKFHTRGSNGLTKYLLGPIFDGPDGWPSPQCAKQITPTVAPVANLASLTRGTVWPGRYSLHGGYTVSHPFRIKTQRLPRSRDHVHCCDGFPTS